MKKIIVLALITLSILAAMLLIAPPGILDSRFYYSPDTAIDFIQGLSDDESRRYLISEILDLFFILAYSNTLVFFFKKFGLSKGAALVPGVLDFLETVLIVLCLSGYLSPARVPFLGLLTLLKWISVILLGVGSAMKMVAARCRD